jgi:hypothetical protein
MNNITITVTSDQLNAILLGLELVERDLESTIRSTIKALDQRLDERRDMGGDLADHVDDQAIALRDYVDMHREATVLYDRLRKAQPNGTNSSGYSSWATGNSTTGDTGCNCAGTMGVRCKPGECDDDIPF